MSYVLPEEVTGIPLFVPTNYDYFSVESGGLPNGDDCLVVHGDVSQSYKAFQKAQTLSPNVFGVRNASGWSISFWIKAGVISAATGIRAAQTIFAVESYDFNWADPMTSTAENNARARFMWGFFHNGGSTTPNIAFYRHISARATTGLGNPRGGQYTQLPLAADAWNFVVVNISAASVSGNGGTVGYVNLTEYQGQETFGNNSGTHEAITGVQYLSLGSYSNGADVGGRAGEWRIAKLAIHDHHLSSDERTLLYDAMVNP